MFKALLRNIIKAYRAQALPPGRRCEVFHPISPRGFMYDCAGSWPLQGRFYGHPVKPTLRFKQAPPKKHALDEVKPLVMNK